MDGERALRRAERLAKGVLALSIGLFGLLVGWTNVVDYDSNWQFVRHVLAMDAFEPWFDGTGIADRAITSEPVQRAFYAAIIAGEFVAGALFAAGGVLLLAGAVRDRAAPVGKALAVLGGTVAVLVWYTGFAVVGGEWFAMWASTWNGQEKAYTFATFILLALLYITRRE